MPQEVKGQAVLTRDSATTWGASSLFQSTLV